MISGRDILHFSLDDYWSSVPHSRHHLTEQFLRNGNRVFWINTFGMRMPSLTKKGNARKIVNKLKSFLKYIRQIDDNFWVCSPIALPLHGSATLAGINDHFLSMQIRCLLKTFRVRNPIIFVTSPMFPHIIEEIQHDKVIYYYSDKYVAYREIKHKEKIIQLDKMTASLADYIFCASTEIYDEVAQNKSNAYYLPHAVDFARFNGVLQADTSIPADMKNIKKPIIGYFGSLTDSNDIELIKFLAAMRPDYSFVLIGKHSVEYEELAGIANIYLLGKKDYREIPLYGKYFDICFMAWKMTEWIKKCSPLKTKEYLALGKPVVAMPIDELVSVYRDVVAVAYDREDFLKKIDFCLKNDSPQKREQRIDFVRSDTWENRFMQMINVIEGNRTS
jgi:glycosyltransferase involved in cell wall biosynthesis